MLFPALNPPLSVSKTFFKKHGIVFDTDLHGERHEESRYGRSLIMLFPILQSAVIRVKKILSCAKIGRK
jgi:hypothetical protein